jgi:catechol 2,3-dioxygenase-like lactoylglutathione lyase family enzyme
MLKGIDHMVIVVRDLDAAVGNYGRLGFTVVRGGRHPSMGTHNALVAFSDGAYFELMAFTPPIADTLNWWYSALTIGGGLVDFCVQTTDLDADAEAFRKAGAAIAKSFRMGRERPDGYKLSWVLATAEGADRGIAPFFINDDTPRDERVPRERTHPNGVTGVRTLTIAVQDTARGLKIYSSVLGNPGERVERPDIGGEGVRFMVGPHELQFVAPTNPAGEVARRLNTRGPSPFEVTLQTTGGKRGVLDSIPAHGARIVLA